MWAPSPWPERINAGRRWGYPGDRRAAVATSRYWGPPPRQRRAAPGPCPPFAAALEPWSRGRGLKDELLARIPESTAESMSARSSRLARTPSRCTSTSTRPVPHDSGSRLGGGISRRRSVLANGRKPRLRPRARAAGARPTFRERFGLPWAAVHEDPKRDPAAQAPQNPPRDTAAALHGRGGWRLFVGRGLPVGSGTLPGQVKEIKRAQTTVRPVRASTGGGSRVRLLLACPLSSPARRYISPGAGVPGPSGTGRGRADLRSVGLVGRTPRRQVVRGHGSCPRAGPPLQGLRVRIFRIRGGLDDPSTHGPHARAVFMGGWSLRIQHLAGRSFGGPPALRRRRSRRQVPLVLDRIIARRGADTAPLCWVEGLDAEKADAPPGSVTLPFV